MGSKQEKEEREQEDYISNNYIMISQNEKFQVRKVTKETIESTLTVNNQGFSHAPTNSYQRHSTFLIIWK